MLINSTLIPRLSGMLAISAFAASSCKKNTNDANPSVNVPRAEHSNAGRSASIRQMPSDAAKLVRLVRAPTGAAGSFLWDQILGLDISSSERRDLFLQLVEGLVADGRLTEAKALIYEKTGPGGDRDALIFSLFTKCELPLEQSLEFVIKNFTDSKEKHSALEGIGRSIVNPSGLTRVEDFLKSGKKLDADSLTAIARGLAQSCDIGIFGNQYYTDPDLPPPISQKELPARFKKNEELLKLMVQSNPDICGEAVKWYLRSATAVSPELAFQAFLRCKGSLDKEEVASTGTIIAKNYGANGGESALTAILQEGNPSELAAGLNGWISKDSQAAESWLRSQRSSMSRTEWDTTVAVIIQEKINGGQIGSAREYAQSITDPQQKAAIEGKIWGRERDSLRLEVAKDPSGTMQAIVNGQSKYGEYWLEEAMGTWISKDFDKAQSWYQDNWNRLPANKAQFLAAAFANQATGQGDTATARQWAAYIQDPKTKQRIEAGIAKAEAAKSN